MTERVIQSLTRQGTWKITVGQKEERFARLTVAQGDMALKVEMVDIERTGGEAAPVEVRRWEYR